MKLQLIKNSNGVLSTELVGVDDDMQTFSYAYKFATNQAGFLVRRYDVFDAVSECGCGVGRETLLESAPLSAPPFELAPRSNLFCPFLY